jgi:NADPH:quinone reductase-like Zn-dependent oxidoreductase
LLHPVVDSTFTLERAAEADDHLDAQAHFGRVVLLVGDKG